MDLPGGDHVDNLEPDEEVEDEGHVAGVVLADNVFELVGVVDGSVERVAIEAEFTAWDDKIAAFGAHGGTDVTAKSAVGLDTAIAEFHIGLRDHVLTAEEEDEKDDHLEE